jgi:hypothetical protein
VTANIGEDQSTPVKIGQMQIYPDLVLTSTDRGRKLMGTVEVETSESVNHLEARAQWAHLGRARAPFHLYVPAGSVEIARRLATENHVNITEMWTYHTIGDQTRFTLVHRASGAEARRAAPEPKVEKPARPVVAAAPRPVEAPRAVVARPAPAAAPKKRPVVAAKKRPSAPPRRGTPARKRVAAKSASLSKSAGQKRK